MCDGCLARFVSLSLVRVQVCGDDGVVLAGPQSVLVPLLCLLQRPNLEAAGVLNLVPGLTDRRLCFSDEEAMM